MEPRSFLRIEGLAVLSIALGSYFAMEGPIWVLLVMALAPDLSMIGYVAGPIVGSLSYNVVHTYTVPLALSVAGIWTGTELAILVALIWAGHIGADRLAGYGLKYDTGFQETHLSRQPAPLAAFTDDR